MSCLCFAWKVPNSLLVNLHRLELVIDNCRIDSVWSQKGRVQIPPEIRLFCIESTNDVNNWHCGQFSHEYPRIYIYLSADASASLCNPMVNGAICQAPLIENNHRRLYIKSIHDSSKYLQHHPNVYRLGRLHGWASQHETKRNDRLRNTKFSPPKA